jgi:hypothetical protein
VFKKKVPADSRVACGIAGNKTADELVQEQSQTGPADAIGAAARNL